MHVLAFIYVTPINQTKYKVNFSEKVIFLVRWRSEGNKGWSRVFHDFIAVIIGNRSREVQNVQRLLCFGIALERVQELLAECRTVQRSWALACVILSNGKIPICRFLSVVACRYGKRTNMILGRWRKCLKNNQCHTCLTETHISGIARHNWRKGKSKQGDIVAVAKFVHVLRRWFGTRQLF